MAANLSVCFSRQRACRCNRPFGVSSAKKRQRTEAHIDETDDSFERSAKNSRTELRQHRKAGARRGSAKLFALNPDGTRGQKLGEAPIVGAGTNVAPGYHGSAQFRFDGGSYDRFLACVIYYDDSNEMIPQAFAFRIGKIDSDPETTLDEIEQPNYRECD
jgi:hypothetical protein